MGVRWTRSRKKGGRQEHELPAAAGKSRKSRRCCWLFLFLRKEMRVRRARLAQRTKIRWRGTAGRNSVYGVHGVRVPDSICPLRAPHPLSCWYSSSLPHTGPPCSFCSGATVQAAACSAVSGPRLAVVTSPVTTLTRIVRHGRRRRDAQADADKRQQFRVLERSPLTRLRFT